MEPMFTRRPDGVIEVSLGSSWPWFTEALLDAVSTRAPRGAEGVNPSTYWIDQALTALASGTDGMLGSGNAWDLRLAGGQVQASSQYADPDEPVEQMPVDALRKLLLLWRREVVAELERRRQ